MNKTSIFKRALSGGVILLYGTPKYTNDFCYVYQTLGNSTYVCEYSDSIDMEKVESYLENYTAVVICHRDVKESIHHENLFLMEELFGILDEMNTMDYEIKPASVMFKETLFAPVLDSIPCNFPFNTVSIGPVGGGSIDVRMPRGSSCGTHFESRYQGDMEFNICGNI